MGGHEAVVQALLEKGAVFNAQGGYYGNALQAASRYGHKAAVQVLLEKGANANFNNGKYSNALKRRLIQHMKDADAFGKERRP